LRKAFIEDGTDGSIDSRSTGRAAGRSDLPPRRVVGTKLYALTPTSPRHATIDHETGSQLSRHSRRIRATSCPIGAGLLDDRDTAIVLERAFDLSPCTSRSAALEGKHSDRSLCLCPLNLSENRENED
jgi:hypothetical protein